MKDEIELRGKYLIYILSRNVDQYEDIPDNETLNYEEFRKQMLNNIAENGNIAK